MHVVVFVKPTILVALTVAIAVMEAVDTCDLRNKPLASKNIIFGYESLKETITDFYL